MTLYFSFGALLGALFGLGIALAMGFGVVRLAHLVVKRDDNAPEA